MAVQSSFRRTSLDQRILFVVFLPLAVVLLVITWVSIRKSRSDSLELLVRQGEAFTEALAQASQNTIAAELFYDRLLRSRYHDLVLSLTTNIFDGLTDAQLSNHMFLHNLQSIYVYDDSGQLLIGRSANASRAGPPDFVISELQQVLDDPESNFILLMEEGGETGEVSHYYIEMTNRLDRVIVLQADAHYYDEAISRTGIGYLAQNIARETGVEYIIYQSTEGIIFASRKPGKLLAIESDPFLVTSLESDTIMHRLYDFQGKRILELVRPFSSQQYPFGLFRVGLSLQRYYDVSRAFDQQMLIISGSLLALLLVLLLYVNSRRKRHEINRQYVQIKSMTDSILEQMRTGVAVIDANGRVVLANAAFQSILGLKDIVGGTWQHAIDGRGDKLEQLMQSNEGEQELSVTIGDDEQTVLIVLSKVGGSGEINRGTILVLYDITRLKEYERTTARKERLTEMGSLAAGVAHEIRNPLNAISIAAQRLDTEFRPDENPEEFHSFTSLIRKETSRLNGIVTRFLALAKERQKHRRSFRLDSILTEIEQLLSDDAEAAGIRLTIESDEKITISGEPDRFKQIFLNLFNNSKEALSGQAGQVRILARRDKNNVIIRFEDSGPGVPEHLREKVFAPYFTTKEIGTGLGLPAVYQIVCDSGGDVFVETSDLGGAAFVIQLPSADKLPSAGEQL